MRGGTETSQRKQQQRLLHFRLRYAIPSRCPSFCLPDRRRLLQLTLAACPLPPLSFSTFSIYISEVGTVMSLCSQWPSCQADWSFITREMRCLLLFFRCLSLSPSLSPSFCLPCFSAASPTSDINQTSWNNTSREGAVAMTSALHCGQQCVKIRSCEIIR